MTRRGRHARRALRLVAAPAAALLVLLTGCAVGGADAATSPPTSAPPNHQTRALATRAAQLVRFAPDSVGYRVDVAGPAAGLRAQTDRGRHVITLFVDPDDAAHRVAHDLGHELGHAYDDCCLTRGERRAYLAARGVPSARWFPARSGSDYATGAGDFAEVFALCHASSPEFRSTLAARPQDPCAALPEAARGDRYGGPR
ncbi:MAG: hypothetical protein QOI54_67 [Actinomycetota bacterium]|nr:hypothetical protein [Actinomycetota bacterium]